MGEEQAKDRTSTLHLIRSQRSNKPDTGHYLYIETSSPRQSIWRLAAILTPTLNGNQYMKFSYHMYGGDVGTLKIYANNRMISSQTGNQGNQWVQAEQPIISLRRESEHFLLLFQVKFEGIRGNDYEGDIAIDAISFTPGSCSSSANSVKCNFDQNSLCSLTNSQNDDFDWTIGRGSTPCYQTGPSQDVFGLGYYAFIETSSPRSQGDKAYLASPKVSGAQCLKFSYHMFGVSMGSLIVYQSMNGLMTEVFKMSGDQGNQWKKAEVELSSGNNYKVRYTTSS
ncbi:MAM and LDL-receptor class A domain-containing protein 1-like [Dendronephthya gigantea]|uniref:MAM and LDL-receptor class A domain-containing protein 1-like n=1 Tax=Dendronephthya gigantea TaxID=151771 RepID=UPI0010693D71|nr:MAM and LDL-receptor class A domain-containing protein 1-like [Dendronephthya gigantea]